MSPAATDLAVLAGRLTERDRKIALTLRQLRLMKTDQIERLLFSDLPVGDSSARQCRRTLAKLCELRVLARLERRIGGVRAGSSGYIYTLAPTGRRLVAHWHEEPPTRRGVHEPGLLFVEHTLQISEVRVLLHEAERAGRLELLSFECEPASWRKYLAASGAALTLKPDFHLRCGVGEWEERCYAEVDLATEGRGALARKLHAYSDYYRSGRDQAVDGIFPRVVWLTTTERRAQLIDAVAQQHAPVPGLVTVARLSDPIAALLGAEVAG